MAALTYPTSLPGPQLAPVSPTERRDATEGYGPRELHAYQRDRHSTQRVQFKFTPAQAAIFVSWVDNTLIFGGCWFSSTWRIPPGGVSVRRLMMSTQQWDFLATGHWLVSIDCEVRGRGEMPEIIEDPYAACQNETFTADIAPYNLLAGSLSGFSNFTDALYGRALRMTAGAGPSSSEIERTFTAITLQSIRFKFRIEALNSDDAGLLYLKQSGVTIFLFDPRRELLFSGGLGMPIGAVGISASPVSLASSGLPVDTWMQFEMICSTATDIVISRASDGVVYGTTAVGDRSAGIANVDALRFLFDEGGTTMSTTSYADIHLCGA